MNSIDKLESFGIKWVPDVYFCDEQGNILYFTQLVKHIKISQIKGKVNGAEWECRFTYPTGNLENWFKIPTDINIKTVYFRTVKRSVETGEDIPFAIAVNNPEFSDFEFELGVNLDNFNFPISFRFTIGQLTIINDEKNIPNVIKEFDKEKGVTYSFIKPSKTFQQIKEQETEEKIINEYSKIPLIHAISSENVKDAIQKIKEELEGNK